MIQLGLLIIFALCLFKIIRPGPGCDRPAVSHRVQKEKFLSLAWFIPTCNPSTWEVEAWRLGVRGHPQLHRSFEVCLGYVSKTKQNHLPEALNDTGVGPCFLGSFFFFPSHSIHFMGCSSDGEDPFAWLISCSTKQAEGSSCVVCSVEPPFQTWSLQCWRNSLIQTPWQPWLPGPLEFCLSLPCVPALPLRPWYASFWISRALRFRDVLYSIYQSHVLGLTMYWCEKDDDTLKSNWMTCGVLLRSLVIL